MSKATQIENMKNTIESILKDYDFPIEVGLRYKVTNDIYRVTKACDEDEDEDEDDKYISSLKNILKDIEDFISTTYSGLLNEDIEEFVEEEKEYSHDFNIYDNNFEVLETTRFTFTSRKMRNLYTHIINNYCRDASRFPVGKSRIDGKTEGVVFTKPPQASKTRGMICAALLRIAQKNNVIIVVDNYNEHLSQIKTSINDLCDELLLGERKYKYHVPAMYLMEARDNLSDIRRSFRRGGAIVCCMNNIKQLRKVSGVKSRHPYIIIHDESDAGLKMDEKEFCGRDIEIRKLFSKADYVLKVTATPSAHFLAEGELIARGSVINGFVPDDYIGMGHEKVRFFSISNNKEHTITKKLKHDFSVPDSPVDKAIKHFLTLPQRDTNEPKVLVINISDRVSAQRSIARQLEDLYPDCCSFVNNGTRMEFYFPYTKEPLEDWPFDDYRKDGFIHSWKSGPYYSDMKSYILDLYRVHGVVENPMFEIAGKKADRSLRLKTSEHTWLPTAILFGSSSNMDFANAYQVLGRICGTRTVKDRHGDVIYTDNETKWAYMSDPIKNTLLEGKAMTEAYIKSETCEEDTMSLVLKEVKITKKQSKVRLSKTATISQQRRRITIIEDKEGSMSRVCRNGYSYKVILEKLNKAHATAIEKVVEWITNTYGTDIPVSRSEIINSLRDEYLQNTLRGYLTRICQSTEESIECEENTPGIVFTKAIKGEEWTVKC